MSKQKFLIVISSPSGGGKTTICKKLLQDPTSPLYQKAEFSISATTRKPRLGEIEGKDYFFLSREVFEEKIQKKDFLEHADVFGNLYGTLKSQISTTKHTLFDIDVQGHKQIKQNVKALSFFLLPPSIDTLKKRIQSRGDLSKEEIERRLATVSTEVSCAQSYDYILINETIETTFSIISGIISSYLFKAHNHGLASCDNFTDLLHSF